MKLKGMSKETAQDLTILELEKIYKDNDKASFLKDPSWPGKSYYDDCKLFEWKQVLVDNHKAYYIKKGLTYPDWVALKKKDDEAALQKLYARLEASFLYYSAIVFFMIQTMIYANF